MNYKEFAQKIKEKYPTYSDMDDKDLAQKMVAKYPEYSDVSFEEPSTQPEQPQKQGLGDKYFEGVINATKAGAERIAERAARADNVSARRALWPQRR